MSRLDRIHETLKTWTEDADLEIIIWIAKKDVEALVEYVDASWELEKGITDFTLHNETVERFKAAAENLLGGES